MKLPQLFVLQQPHCWCHCCCPTAALLATPLAGAQQRWHVFHMPACQACGVRFSFVGTGARSSLGGTDARHGMPSGPHEYVQLWCTLPQPRRCTSAGQTKLLHCWVVCFLH